MNPFDYWITAHPDLKNELDLKYRDEISRWKGSNESQKMLDTVYRCGTAQEKTLALTVLYATNRIFS